MSYIRCTSNPEGLYIYSTINGLTSISDCQLKPLSNLDGRDMLVPTKDFIAAIIKLDGRYPEDPLNINGFKIQSLQIFVDNGEKVPLSYNEKLLFHGDKGYRKTRSVIKLQYKNKFTTMWYVTFSYIKNNINRRFNK